MSQNLSTLDGISNAREDLYNKLIDGKVEREDANILERILRGQTHLKGDLQLKFLSLIIKNKGALEDPNTNTPIVAIMKRVQKFLGEGEAATT